jgi:WD40 repeat protein
VRLNRLPIRVLQRSLGAIALLTLTCLGARADDRPAPLFRMGGDARPTGVSRLAFAPDGKTVAWAGSGPVCLYDATNGKLLRKLKADGRCVAFAPDGKTLAVGDGVSVRIFTVGGEETAHFEAQSGGVLTVAFSPDGKALAAGGDDDHVTLWEPATSKERSRVPLNNKGVSVLAFSPDGKLLAGGGEAGELTVWRLGDDYVDERRRLMGKDGPVRCVAFLPDGKAFLWTQGPTIRVSEVETWVELSRYGGDIRAACYALAPDGKTLATGGGTTSRLWDLETGEELMTLHDEKVEPAAVAFAPDGKAVAAAGRDGTVLLWDLRGLPRARMEAWWRELGGRDAADAVHAVKAMTASPADSVAFLRERMRPAPPPDPRVGRLIADLDSDDFDAREKASAELAKRGREVEAELRKAFADRPSPEARWRLQALLDRLKDTPSEETAKERAVQVLETIGTDDARRLLETLTKGRPESRLTVAAKAALQRMGERPER